MSSKHRSISLLGNQIKNLRNKKSYISITIGFITVAIAGILVYNYFPNIIRGNSSAKKNTTQAANEQKTTNIQQTYTVEKGDDLWRIANKFYGDGFAWAKIAKANNLDKPNTIHPDNNLIIPE